MENLREMVPNGAGIIFCPANPDLADIVGDTDWVLRISVFYILLIPSFWISSSPYLQIPRFPDGAGAGAAGEQTLRS